MHYSRLAANAGEHPWPHARGKAGLSLFTVWIAAQMCIPRQTFGVTGAMSEGEQERSEGFGFAGCNYSSVPSFLKLAAAQGRVCQ